MLLYARSETPRQWKVLLSSVCAIRFPVQAANQDPDPGGRELLQVVPEREGGAAEVEVSKYHPVFTTRQLL